MTAAILGVDVADVGQQRIDAAAAAPHIVFGICKASEGLTFTDPSFVHNRDGIRAAGRIPGAYHFLRSTAGGAQQCDRWLRTIGGPDGQLLALDVEPRSGDRSMGREAAPFLAEFAKQAPGRKILVYSNRGLWAACGGPQDISGFPVVGWHAGIRDGVYTPARGPLDSQWSAAGSTFKPSPFGGISVFPMAQFTDHAIVPGISSPCDGDVWLATLDDLRALAGLGPTQHATHREDDMPQLRKHPGDNAIYWINGASVKHVTSMTDAAELAAELGVDLGALKPIDGTVLGYYSQAAAAPVDVKALAAAIVTTLPAGTVAPTAEDIAAATVDLLAARAAN